MKAKIDTIALFNALLNDKMTSETNCPEYLQDMVKLANKYGAFGINTMIFWKEVIEVLTKAITEEKQK